MLVPVQTLLLRFVGHTLGHQRPPVTVARSRILGHGRFEETLLLLRPIGFGQNDRLGLFGFQLEERTSDER